MKTDPTIDELERLARVLNQTDPCVYEWVAARHDLDEALYAAAPMLIDCARRVAELDREKAKLEAALELADRVETEAWAMLRGGDDGLAEVCPECGCGGYGYLRDALKDYRAALAGRGGKSDG